MNESAAKPKRTNESATAILKKWEANSSDRETWKGHADLNARFFKPQLDYTLQQPGTPDFQGFRGLFTSAGIDALSSFTLGLIAEVFPSNEKWMVWTAQDDHKVDDSARKWYNQCGEIAITHLSRSNFYQSIKPMLDDMGVAGTGAVSVRKGKRSLLAFHYCVFGSYHIEEDSEGFVKTLYRCFKRTAEQIVEQFGKENIGESVRKELENPNSTKKFEVIHACFPRDDRNEKSMASDEMPYASIYVCKEDKNILEHGGQEAFPYGVVRAERWDEKVFGLSPATKAMPTMQQANRVMRDLDESIALQTRPPWMTPSGALGNVDRRPNGMTVWDAAKSGGQKPEQMNIKNDIRAGMEHYKMKVEEIRAFFHASLFEAIADKTKQMTAREVAAIENSALRRFLPQFNQLTNELSPIFSQVFEILFAAGVFPAPPESALVPAANGYEIPPPKVEFTSRIALAIRMVENQAMDRTLERIAGLAALDPSIAMRALDNFDLDEMMRLASRNDGTPESVLILLDKVKEGREAAAQQAQQQQQLEMANQAAQAAKTAGDTNAEGVGNLLQMAS